MVVPVSPGGSTLSPVVIDVDYHSSAEKYTEVQRLIILIALVGGSIVPTTTLTLIA
jgi:hypothetical protein